MSQEVPIHGAQGDPVTSDDSLQLFETDRELLGPAIVDVAMKAASTVERIMSRGSDKSVFGQWFHTDSMRYNADRCINHLATAMMQFDGNRPNPDAQGENAIAHLERALVRAAFLLFKAEKGKLA